VHIKENLLKSKFTNTVLGRLRTQADSRPTVCLCRQQFAVSDVSADWHQTNVTSPCCMVIIRSTRVTIFARSSSAVTPSEKSSINTNRKSTTRFSPASTNWSMCVCQRWIKGVNGVSIVGAGAKNYSKEKCLCLK